MSLICTSFSFRDVRGAGGCHGQEDRLLRRMCGRCEWVAIEWNPGSHGCVLVEWVGDKVLSVSHN